MNKHRFPAATAFRLLTFSFFVALLAPSGGWAQSAEPQSDQAQAIRSAADPSNAASSPVIVDYRRDTRYQQSMGVSSSPREKRQNVHNKNQDEPQAAARDKPEEPEKGTFEAYVQAVTGKNPGVFAKDLFGNVPTTFSPLESSPVNSDYVIGADDELQIRAWGMVDIDMNQRVDRNGEIHIPRVGSIKVAGVKYGDLQPYLKNAVGRVFRNFELVVSIARSRAVQIYVVGHAARPGTYTLNGMSTMLNALFASGGPSGTGTMRNIQLRRGAQTIATFDLYDVLTKGDKSGDLSLRDGDMIYIPEVGPLVALTGDVKQPAIFELKGPSSLADLISWAGGFNSAADHKQVIIEKNVDNKFQTVLELPAGNSTETWRLAEIAAMPTDVVRVFSPNAVPVQVRIENEFVRISGEVKNSGVFRLQKGETLKEFILRIGGTTENGYVFATRFTRESIRTTQQEKLDEVADRFEREMENNASQRLSSADKDNFAVVSENIERQRVVAQKMKTVKADGRVVLELSGESARVEDLPDLPLQNGDSITIPRRPGTIDVLGSVFQPNTFIFKPNRSVSDYLKLAGGPTTTANKSEIYLIRADGTALSNRNNSLFGDFGGYRISPGDTIVVPEKIDRTSWTQTLKDWTSILYQFGLGAAGIKAASR